MAENREYQSVDAVVQEVDPPKQYQAMHAVVDSRAEEAGGGGGFIAFPHPRGLNGGMHRLSGGMQ